MSAEKMHASKCQNFLKNMTSKLLGSEFSQYSPETLKSPSVGFKQKEVPFPSNQTAGLAVTGCCRGQKYKWLLKQDYKN